MNAEMLDGYRLGLGSACRTLDYAARIEGDPATAAALSRVADALRLHGASIDPTTPGHP